MRITQTNFLCTFGSIFALCIYQSKQIPSCLSFLPAYLSFAQVNSTCTFWSIFALPTFLSINLSKLSCPFYLPIYLSIIFFIIVCVCVCVWVCVSDHNLLTLNNSPSLHNTTRIDRRERKCKPGKH